MNERLRILLVDDDPTSRRTLAEYLSRSGDLVDPADDGRVAQNLLATRVYDLVLCDVRSPRVDAATLCDAVRARSPGAMTILVSAFASVEQVNSTLRQGVYDFLLKPIEPQQVATMLARVRDRIVMRRRLEALREALVVRDALAVVLSGGPTSASVQQLLRVAASSDEPVMLVGEVGTGRGLIARAIHALSARAEMPFAFVDCTGDLMRVQAALLGTAAEPGGQIQTARGGTIVMEPVSALSPELRARVLHAVTQPGAPRVIAISADFPAVPPRRDARRTELLAWVRGVEIVMPPLRERREDIPRLAEHYAAVAAGDKRVPPRFAPEVMAMLIEAPWAGNLRELETVIRESVARAGTSATLTREHLPAELARRVDHGSSLVEQVEAYERAVVRRALETVHGAVARAAKELGVPERTLRRKMRHFGIAKESFRKRSRHTQAPVAAPRS